MLLFVVFKHVLNKDLAIKLEYAYYPTLIIIAVSRVQTQMRV